MLVDLPEKLLEDIVAFRKSLYEMDDATPPEEFYQHHYGTGIYNLPMLELDLKVMDSDFKINEWSWDALFVSNDVDERFAYMRTRIEAGLPLSNYGICDHPTQIAEKWPFILTDPKMYFILVRPWQKGFNGGVRWHKQGAYIGDLDLEGYEYIDDEPEVGVVYGFSVVEIEDLGSYAQ